MGRQQLPRGITKVEVLDRRTGKKVPRWRVTVNIGRGDERRQVRRSFGTERAARDYLDEVRGKIQSGTYVRAAKRPVKTRPSTSGSVPNTSSSRRRGAAMSMAVARSGSESSSATSWRSPRSIGRRWLQRELEEGSVGGAPAG